MDSIKDIFTNSKGATEPPQLSALKKYLNEKYNDKFIVGVSKDRYSVIAPNSSLAGLVRMHQNQIVKECNLDKELVITIRH